jgi:hypothetical protein
MIFDSKKWHEENWPEQPRMAFVDENGILIGHAYMREHPGCTAIEVSHDFNLTPLQFRYSNGDWIPYTPPAQQVAKIKRWFAFWRK